MASRWYIHWYQRYIRRDQWHIRYIPPAYTPTIGITFTIIHTGRGEYGFIGVMIVLYLIGLVHLCSIADQRRGTGGVMIATMAAGLHRGMYSPNANPTRSSELCGRYIRRDIGRAILSRSFMLRWHLSRGWRLDR